MSARAGENGGCEYRTALIVGSARAISRLLSHISHMEMSAAAMEISKLFPPPAAMKRGAITIEGHSFLGWGEMALTVDHSGDLSRLCPGSSSSLSSHGLCEEAFVSFLWKA